MRSGVAFLLLQVVWHGGEGEGGDQSERAYTGNGSSLRRWPRITRPSSSSVEGAELSSLRTGDDNAFARSLQREASIVGVFVVIPVVVHWAMQQKDSAWSTRKIDAEECPDCMVEDRALRTGR